MSIKKILTVVVASAASACITTVNAVGYKPLADAPALEPRAEGCAVEIFDENEKPSHPFQVIGRMELSWSQRQMEEQGPEYAMKTLKTAVCEQGGHYLLDMRALPRGFKEGMLFEGDVAVILGDDGKPLQGVATGTASSTEGVTAPAIAPATTTPASEPAPTPSPAPTP
jgi:hypothetical protein